MNTAAKSYKIWFEIRRSPTVDIKRLHIANKNNLNPKYQRHPDNRNSLDRGIDSLPSFKLTGLNKWLNWGKDQFKSGVCYLRGRLQPEKKLRDSTKHRYVSLSGGRAETDHLYLSDPTFLSHPTLPPGLTSGRLRGGRSADLGSALCSRNGETKGKRLRERPNPCQPQQFYFFIVKHTDVRLKDIVRGYGRNKKKQNTKRIRRATPSFGLIGISTNRFAEWCWVTSSLHQSR